jgi:hypothetical protein
MSSEKFMNFGKPRRRLRAVTPASEKMQALPPVFLTRKLRKAIERLLPTNHHQRLRYYFEIYGCLHCSRKTRIYGANGFCRVCISMIGKRIRKLDRELQARALPQAPRVEEIYLRSYNCARRLLADLRPAIGKQPIGGKPSFKSPRKASLTR